MPTPTEMLTALDTALEKRLAGGHIRSYTLPNGQSVNLDSLDDVFNARQKLQRLQDEAANQSPFHVARLRPR